MFPVTKFKDTIVYHSCEGFANKNPSTEKGRLQYNLDTQPG